EGLLEIMQWLFTADLLERYNVWIDPLNHFREQNKLLLEPLLIRSRRPQLGAEKVLDVPRHHFESRHYLSLFPCRLERTEFPVILAHSARSPAEGLGS